MKVKVVAVIIMACWAINVKAQDCKIQVYKSVHNVKKPIAFYMVFAKDTVWSKLGMLTISKTLNDKYANSLFKVHIMENGLGKFRTPLMLTQPTQLSELCKNSPFTLQLSNTN